MSTSDVGVIGMAVMGKNLALNIADHGFKVGIYNRTGHVTDEVMAENPGKSLVPAKTLAELVGGLTRPRRLLVMVKAGAPVDAVLTELSPLLEKGDVVIDGGNTWFPETQRREKDFASKGLNFVGMGVSGGEEGARFGPSLMPGGTKQAWDSLRPVLEAISAKTDSGPCVTHVGPDGAGHFVKMVHNGIEYGVMQAYAEGFEAVLSREERVGYHDLEHNTRPVASHVERVRRAEALVLCFPVWNFGYPAILKGFFDRVFLPGVSFRMVDGKATPNLWTIRKLAAVATYGGSRWRALLMGDPPRKVVCRALRAVCHPTARPRYLAHYDMNRSSPESRAAFLAKVAEKMRAL